MPVERAAGGTSLVDVLDRVLDKGIVIDAWVRVSLVGIDLITVEARVVVASIDTYLKYAEAVGQVSTVSRPVVETTAQRTRRGERRAARRARRTQSRRRGPRQTPQNRGNRTDVVVTTDAKLSLVEFLLAADDVSVSAQHGLEWLCTHVGVQRALCATTAVDPRRYWGVAALGISPAQTGEFFLDLEDDAHPLVAAAHGSGPVHFPVGPRQPETPLESAPFTVIPLRSGQQRSQARRPAPDRHGAADARSRHPVVRRSARREADAAAQPHDPVGPRPRSRAPAALQHHQRGHRSDPADRHVRQADHRQPPRRAAVRGARR